MGSSDCVSDGDVPLVCTKRDRWFIHRSEWASKQVNRKKQRTSSIVGSIAFVVTFAHPSSLPVVVLLLLLMLLLVVLVSLARLPSMSPHLLLPLPLAPTAGPKPPDLLAQRRDLRVLPPHLSPGRPVQRRGVPPQRLVLRAQLDALRPDQRHLPLQRPDAPLGLRQPRLQLCGGQGLSWEDQSSSQSTRSQQTRTLNNGPLAPARPPRAGPGPRTSPPLPPPMPRLMLILMLSPRPSWMLCLCVRVCGGRWVGWSSRKASRGGEHWQQRASVRR